MVESDRRAAIARALNMARPGDTVLLAGKGHETYQEICGVRHHLDEREVVAACFPDGAQARLAMAKTEEDRGDSLDFS